MRIRNARILLACVVCINFPLFYYTWKLLSTSISLESFGSSSGANISKETKIDLVNNHHPYKHLKNVFTIVFRDFFNFENDLTASVGSILSILPNIKVYLVNDNLPYPPLEILNISKFKENIKFISLEKDLVEPIPGLQSLDSVIKTPYTFLIPDSVRINSKSVLQKMLREISIFETRQIKGNIDETLFIIPFVSNDKTSTQCEQISIDLPFWTIEYNPQNETLNCDMFIQKHAILGKTKLLSKIPNFLASPFPELLFLYAKVSKIKVRTI